MNDDASQQAAGSVYGARTESVVTWGAGWPDVETAGAPGFDQ